MSVAATASMSFTIIIGVRFGHCTTMKSFRRLERELAALVYLLFRYWQGTTNGSRRFLADGVNKWSVWLSKPISCRKYD
jgi:hypothetical protein